MTDEEVNDKNKKIFTVIDNYAIAYKELEEIQESEGK